MKKAEGLLNIVKDLFKVGLFDVEIIDENTFNDKLSSIKL